MIDNRCKHRKKGVCEIDTVECPLNFVCSDYVTDDENKKI